MWILKVAAIAVLSSFPVQAGSLYEDLGGMETIKRISSRTLDLTLSSELTREHFRFVDMTRVKEKLALQICEVSDGPCVYDGDPMKPLHKPMQITTAEFNAVVEHLQQALREANMPFRVQNKLVGRLAPLHRDIVTKR